MKKIQRISVLPLILLVLAACGKGEEAKKPVAKPVQSVVFLDKSASVFDDVDYVNRKYAKALQDIVNGNIRTQGDRLDIYYVHENTGKAQVFSDVCQAAVLEDTTYASPTDKEAIRNDFQLALRKEKSEFLNQALTHLMKPNPTATSRNTDIWATLEVVNRIADTAATVNAYYFSDMIESMPGSNRRDFHVKPPKTRAEAETWAKTDGSTLKGALRPEIAGKLNVYMVSPFKPTSTTKENNPNVTYYWEQLFKEIGVSQPVREIN
jgi:hypothetical protein